jgi:hypothetical protein
MKNTKKLLCALALSLPICTFAMDENRSKSRSRAFTFQQEVAPVAEKSSLQKCKETFSTLEKHDKLLLVTSMSRSMSPKSLIAAAQILLQSAATQSKALTADSNLALLHTQQAITNMLQCSSSSNGNTRN